MAPPAKRQRRNVTRPSKTHPSNPAGDDDGACESNNTQLSDEISSPVSAINVSPPASMSVVKKPPLTPVKPKSRATAANHPHNAAPIYLPNRAAPKTAGRKSASISPEKAKGKGKSAENIKSGDILKLFSSQIQRQKTATKDTNPTHCRPGPELRATAEDKLYDVSSDNDDIDEGQAQTASFIGAAAKKRSHNATFGNMAAVSSSQKFLRRPTMKPIMVEADRRPWAEQFAPANLDELAVHKKKVADVRGWLESVIGGRIRQRLLVLKGAAGTGKTTTIHLLAKDMGCEVLEWRNPSGAMSSSDGFISMAAQFEEFIGRGGKYGQLEMLSEGGTQPSQAAAKPLDRRKSMILVEEFPNTFMRSSTGMESFRSSILQYLVANTPPLSMMYKNSDKVDPITPMIMIISETLLTTSTAAADSFTAYRLLGPEISQHPGVTVIEFNAIAPTLLAKALELVVVKESRKSGRRTTPGPLVLKKLGEIGDIRSAIGSLEFLCLKGDEGGEWGAKVSFGKVKKTTKDSISLTKMEEESLELVTRREASLGIFHAVGKVVYNKRDEVQYSRPDQESVERLPEFLSDKARPRKSQVSIDELIDETGTDTQTFVAALHENYTLSCDAPPSSYEFSDLDHVAGCIDALSDSDMVCPAQGAELNITSYGRRSSGDILRQDEFCFQIAVRGILFALPYPVKRRAPSTAGLRTGRSGDAFKMFYPTALKLWRTQEEIEGMVDLWVTRLMKGDDHIRDGITAGATIFAKPKPGSVETWRNNFNADTTEEKKSSPDDSSSTPVIGIGASAKKEMLLERLPYMVMMAKGKKRGGSSPAIREMEKVTLFTGITPPSEENPDGGDDHSVTEGWATDKPVEAESPRKVQKWKRRGQGEQSLESRFAEQKLVLSDDEIEDFD